MTLQNLSKHFVTGMTLALGAAVFSAGDLQAQEHAGHEEHTGHDNMHETMHSMEYLGGRPNSPFSEAVRVGNVLYLSGKLGTIPGEGLAEGGIVPETEQTMRNIQDALERYGSSMDKVIKCTAFLADIADFADFSRTYMSFFPENRPARSTLAVGGLVLNARVEIECMAAVGDNGS